MLSLPPTRPPSVPGEVFYDFLTIFEMVRLGKLYLLSFAMTIKIKCH